MIRTRTITSLLKYAVAVLMATASLTAAQAAEKPPETLTIGYQKANILSLLKSRGTLDEALEKQGIKPRWIEFTAGPQMLEALNVGSIDLAATGDAPPIFAQAARADLVYLAHGVPNPKTEAIVVPESSDIRSVSDLKGKRVALNKGSDVNYLLIRALEREGLSYSDIKPVYLKPGDARAAFQQGSVDAWVIWDPYYAEVELRGHARRLADATNLVPHYTFFLASRNFAEAHPQTAHLVIETLRTLSQWANEHPDDAAASLADSSGLDVGIWQHAIARMPFGIERMQPDILDGQQTLADTFKRVGLIPVSVDVSEARWSDDDQP
ncbi:sulfonate transport system substrate-binding protein [Kushneria avicenniae]|uniref:Putative aliphatic sulfonates-binding protein n=1 Tax=Kushneria avicenniae TaxID=402385 RepID=A0A1I1LGR5_9GAMM|nr:sulfonate ABC transporter substrate-binding protein [Kushneria avicenniae]SFC72229.1 sulfonate transport system substrate-binding protein [Kushneria avicenniae]